MADFFALELDTTGPDVTITAPSYTIPQIETEIMVRASEVLAPYQEFYIIDGYGRRYDLIFEHLGDSFRGIYNFADVPLGICTVYARVRDEVFNLSPLVSVAINVRQPAPIDLTISCAGRELIVNAADRSPRTSSSIRNVMADMRVQPINSSTKVREIEVKIK